jgi:hypothetical protein
MMSEQWEYGEEYLEIKSAFRHAQKAGDHALCEQLRPRIEELDRMMWHSMTDGLPELAPYQTVVQALQQTASRLGLRFPDLSDSHNRTGDGQFLFGVSDGQRTVQIWPMEDRGSYSIEVYDYEHTENGACYQGHTTSLEEATIVLSQWFVERCSIGYLHTQFAWMSREPLQLSGSRMTFE